MAVLSQENKIIKNQAGEVLVEDSAPSSKLLQIDSNDQIPNMILKSQADNKVKQITDKANGIIFTQSDTAKQPVFKHDGYYEIGAAYGGFLGKSPVEFTNNITISFWFKTTTTSNTAVMFDTISGDGVAFYVYLNNLNNQIVFNASYGGLEANVAGVDLNDGEWHHIAVVNDSDNDTVSRFYTDGIYCGVGSLSDLSGAKTISLFINKDNQYGVLNSGWKGVVISKDIVIKYNNFTLGEEAFTPKEPFSYYHRYKDDGFNKLYLSSKFTKDSGISDTNKVERIYNSILGTYFEELTNKPTLTKNGFLYATGEILTQAISNEYTYGLSDFFIGQWVDFNSESDVFNIGGLIKIGIDSTNIYAETIGGKLYATRLNVINEGKKYIGFHREGGNIYLTVGGVFENSRVEAIDYNTDVTATIGGSFIGLHDDLLNAKNSIITFVGKSQSNKVFEPPIRGGFDSIIKQY